MVSVVSNYGDHRTSYVVTKSSVGCRKIVCAWNTAVYGRIADLRPTVYCCAAVFNTAHHYFDNSSTVSSMVGCMAHSTVSTRYSIQLYRQLVALFHGAEKNIEILLTAVIFGKSCSGNTAKKFVSVLHVMCVYCKLNG